MRARGDTRCLVLPAQITGTQSGGRLLEASQELVQLPAHQGSGRAETEPGRSNRRDQRADPIELLVSVIIDSALFCDGAHTEIGFSDDD